MIFKLIQYTPLFDLICAFLRTFSIFIPSFFLLFIQRHPISFAKASFLKNNCARNPLKMGILEALLQKSALFRPFLKNFYLHQKRFSAILLGHFISSGVHPPNQC